MRNHRDYDVEMQSGSVDVWLLKGLQERAEAAEAALAAEIMKSWKMSYLFVAFTAMGSLAALATFFLICYLQWWR